MRDAIGALVLLASLAAALRGIVGLISPRSAYWHSRWQAFPWACAPILGIGGGLLVMPSPGQAGDNMGVGLTFCALWGGMLFAARNGARNSRAVDAPVAKPLPADPRDREIARLKAEVDVYQQRLRQGQAAPIAADRKPRAPPAPTRPKPRRRDPNAPTVDNGSLAAFVYVDVDGVVTDRTVSNWSIEGAHLKGYCLERRAVRTFRMDRIEEWIAWEP